MDSQPSKPDQARPLLRTIAQQGRSIVYNPLFACLTGGAISALLLQQMIYWWDAKGFQKFYKFKIPAQKHKAYRDGDSWCEELALTRHEFDTALKRIATKIDAAHTRESFYKYQMPHPEDFAGYEDGYVQALEDTVKHFISYWTDPDRKTWYEVNDTLIETFLNQALEPRSGIRLCLARSGIRLYKVNPESGFTYTEMTTQKNKDSNADTSIGVPQDVSTDAPNASTLLTAPCDAPEPPAIAKFATPQSGLDISNPQANAPEVPDSSTDKQGLIVHSKERIGSQSTPPPTPSPIEEVDCTRCNGTGEILTADQDWVPCGECHGQGYVEVEPLTARNLSPADQGRVTTPSDAYVAGERLFEEAANLTFTLDAWWAEFGAGAALTDEVTWAFITGWREGGRKQRASSQPVTERKTLAADPPADRREQIPPADKNAKGIKNDVIPSAADRAANPTVATTNTVSFKRGDPVWYEYKQRGYGVQPLNIKAIVISVGKKVRIGYPHTDGHIMRKDVAASTLRSRYREDDETWERDVLEPVARPANLAFDAIAKYVFKLEKTPKGGAIGTMINAIKDCLDEKHHATLGEDLTNAFAWWTSKPVPNSPNGETYNAPGSALKICRMLADWRESGSPARASPDQPVWGQVPDPDNPGFYIFGWVTKESA